MKKKKKAMRYVIIFLSLALVLTASLTNAQQVANTPHDIAWPLAGRYICVSCHTPNGALANGPLLWNRNRIGNATTYYNSATFDMGPASATNAGPQTYLCLTCHDGGASTLVNYPGPGSIQNTNYDLAAGQIGTFANIGNTLADDHPVAFVYNASLDQGGNNFPPAAPNGIITGKDTGTVYRLYANNTFQCATCHAVHDNGGTYTKAGWNGLGNARTGSGEVYFLRTSNAASQMCFDCHF